MLIDIYFKLLHPLHRNTSQSRGLMSPVYLYKRASNGAASELVQQGFTHGYIRNASHSICDYYKTCTTKEKKIIILLFD